MECYKCGAALGKEAFCPACGADVKLYKKIIHSSNQCYNEGLEQARVRDLSGAAASLRRSLKYYKGNIPARNLLGLVYFEMGETVDALGEWVISRSLHPENNMAEKYLSSVQSNGNKLDSLNQTIKKYNQALMYCRQDSKDLAVIQLKKVLGLNPRLVKGHQLLALLYMEEGQYELARRSLRNAAKIDTNNTTTLRYLREMNRNTQGEQSAKKKGRKEKGRKEKEELVAYQSGNETIIHPATFKDNSAVSTILNIVVGVIIGVLITWFLVVPSIRQKVVSESNQAVREANDTISTKNQTIQTLEQQVESLEAQLAEMEGKESDIQGVITMHEQLLSAYDAYVKEDVETAAAILEKVDAQELTGNASTIYQEISAQINAGYIDTLYEQGEAAYNSRDYEEASSKLQIVVDADETYQEGYAVYYLAQSYRELEQNEQAVTYYQRVMELYPGTQRARTAERYVDELGVPEDPEDTEQE